MFFYDLLFFLFMSMFVMFFYIVLFISMFGYVGAIFFYVWLCWC